MISLETRAKISAAMKGKKRSPETCAKMSAAHVGKKHSSETLAKMRTSRMGRTFSAETRAKIGASLRQALVGVPHTHGHCVNGAWTKKYAAWKSMLRRTRSTYGRAKDYFLRGITVEDPRWLKFEAFNADVPDPPPGPGWSIDRIDNDKGYYKSNVRWATASEQQQNTRRKQDV